MNAPIPDDVLDVVNKRHGSTRLMTDGFRYVLVSDLVTEIESLRARVAALRLASPSQVAVALGVSTVYVRKLIDAEKIIGAVRVGKNWQIPVDARGLPKIEPGSWPKAAAHLAPPEAVPA